MKQRKISHIKINDTQELKVWYDFGEKIGEGSFGTVTAVKEKTTNKNWAMKTVSKSVTSSINCNLLFMIFIIGWGVTEISGARTFSVKTRKSSSYHLP